MNHSIGGPLGPQPLNANYNKARIISSLNTSLDFNNAN